MLVRIGRTKDDLKMKMAKFGLVGLGIVSISYLNAKAQQENAPAAIQSKIKDYAQQVTSKGEFETSSESAARAKRVHDKMATLLPQTFGSPCSVTAETYDADNKTLRVTTRSSASSIDFTVRMDRTDAIQFGKAVAAVRGEITVGVNPNGNKVPVACKFVFHSKKYGYQDLSARMAWVMEEQSLPAGIGYGMTGIWKVFWPTQGYLLYPFDKDSMYVLDVSGGKILESYRPHSGRTTTDAISVDSSLLATASSNGAKTWKIHGMTLLRTEIALFPVADLAFGGMLIGPFAKRILVGAGPNELWHWVLDFSNCQKNDQPKFFAMSKKEADQRIASLKKGSGVEAMRNDRTNSWREPDFQKDISNIFEMVTLYKSGVVASPGQISSISFLPDSQQVLSLYRCGRGRFWDLNSGLEGKRINFGCPYVIVNRSGTCLGTQWSYSPYHLFDIANSQNLVVIAGRPGFALSPIGRLIATSNHYTVPIVVIYDSHTGTPLSTFNNCRRISYMFLRFSNSGERLVTINEFQNNNNITILILFYRSLYLYVGCCLFDRYNLYHVLT